MDTRPRVGSKEARSPQRDDFGASIGPNININISLSRSLPLRPPPSSLPCSFPFCVHRKPNPACALGAAPSGCAPPVAWRLGAKKASRVCSWLGVLLAGCALAGCGLAGCVLAGCGLAGCVLGCGGVLLAGCVLFGLAEGFKDLGPKDARALGPRACSQRIQGPFCREAGPRGGRARTHPRRMQGTQKPPQRAGTNGPSQDVKGLHGG